MKGYIEVTCKQSGYKQLINISQIQMVVNSEIYFNLVLGETQDYIKCVESYEEIKKLIEEATV